MSLLHRNQNWSSHIVPHQQSQLRRQKSFAETRLNKNETISQSLNDITDSQRKYSSQIQKQFSVDQVLKGPISLSNVRRGFGFTTFKAKKTQNEQSKAKILSSGSRTSLNVNSNGGRNKESSQKLNGFNNCSEDNPNVVSKNWPSVKTVINENCREESANDFLTRRKFFPPNGSERKDFPPSSFSTEKSDGKFNINIILTQTVTDNAEGNHSDVDVDSSSELPEVANENNDDLRASKIKTSSQLNYVNSAATNLRFLPSLTIQHRPPLIRAMSAPVRFPDETIATNKRKQRRRKVHEMANNEYANDGGNNNDPTKINENGNNKQRVGAVDKKFSRSQSAVAAPEVVTLVSLVSSDGSDSEKDESSEPIIENILNDRETIKRAPLLRKNGKSVSFQENHVPNFFLSSKEFSHKFRHGSIVPLASRIRANRPPTAPPVSIFLSNAEASKPPDLKIEKLTQNKLQSSGEMTTQNDTDFPEYVFSAKERECWKLYQKMLAKGVNVTYNVILRGMLTPTEFRQFQKQRELEEAKVRKSEDDTETSSVGSS